MSLPRDCRILQFLLWMDSSSCPSCQSKAIPCPWLSAHGCLKQCERTLVLASSDAWLSTCSPSWTIIQEMWYWREARRDGRGTGFIHLLPGRVSPCVYWAAALSTLWGRALVWSCPIVQCCYTVAILFPGWCTSVESWKGEWGCGRSQIYGPSRPRKSYLMLYGIIICVPILCSLLA